MRKKYLSVIMSVVLVATLATGCSSKSNTSSTTSATSTPTATEAPATTAAPEATADNTTVYGKVTKISGSKITIEVLTRDTSVGGGQGGRQMPSGSGAPDGGQKPSGSGAPDGGQKPSGTGAPDGGQQPSSSGQPSGDQKSMPSTSGSPSKGKMGKNSDGMMFGYTDTGKKQTITISDDITIQSISMDQTATDATTDDITKGCIIQITYNNEDKETITSVAIMNMSGGNAMPQGGQEAKSDDSSSDDTDNN